MQILSLDLTLAPWEVTSSVDWNAKLSFQLGDNYIGIVVVYHCLILVWYPPRSSHRITGVLDPVSQIIQVLLQGALTPGVGRLELFSMLWAYGSWASLFLCPLRIFSVLFT